MIGNVLEWINVSIYNPNKFIYIYDRCIDVRKKVTSKWWINKRKEPTKTKKFLYQRLRGPHTVLKVFLFLKK